MATWVTLAHLRADFTVPAGAVEDARLQAALDAAAAFVEGARTDQAAGFAAGLVADDIRLGTVRLAARWYRRRLQEGQPTTEFGVVGAVPYSDPDIDRLLGLGKHGRSVIA